MNELFNIFLQITIVLQVMAIIMIEVIVLGLVPPLQWCLYGLRVLQESFFLLSIIRPWFLLCSLESTWTLDEVTQVGHVFFVVVTSGSELIVVTPTAASCVSPLTYLRPLPPQLCIG